MLPTSPSLFVSFSRGGPQDGNLDCDPSTTSLILSEAENNPVRYTYRVMWDVGCESHSFTGTAVSSDPPMQLDAAEFCSSPSPYPRAETSPIPRLPGYIPGVPRPMTPRETTFDPDNASSNDLHDFALLNPTGHSITAIPSVERACIAFRHVSARWTLPGHEAEPTIS